MEYHFTYDCVKENLYYIEVKKARRTFIQEYCNRVKTIAVDRGVKLNIAETKDR